MEINKLQYIKNTDINFRERIRHLDRIREIIKEIELQLKLRNK
jgi:hypothetical protein